MRTQISVLFCPTVGCHNSHDLHIVFFVVNYHLQPLLGILQGFGAPSCAKILTSWFAAKERGTYWVSKRDFRCDSIFSIYSYARSACRACGILPTILEFCRTNTCRHCCSHTWMEREFRVFPRCFCLAAEMFFLEKWGLWARESSPSLLGH